MTEQQIREAAAIVRVSPETSIPSDIMRRHVQDYGVDLETAHERAMDAAMSGAASDIVTEAGTLAKIRPPAGDGS